MSKRAFNKIMQGVKEARTYLEGTAGKSRFRLHLPKAMPESRKEARERGGRKFGRDN